MADLKIDLYIDKGADPDDENTYLKGAIVYVDGKAYKSYLHPDLVYFYESGSEELCLDVTAALTKTVPDAEILKELALFSNTILEGLQEVPLPNIQEVKE